MKFFYAHRHGAGQRSHPARGAWIEISVDISRAVRAAVAPRKGCVD